MKQQKYRLLISYDGTSFGGWQVQPNSPSIQGLIQESLQIILRETPLHVTGSGRTDAGVHAKGQVAHFTFSKPFDLKRTLHSLNALLPPEIRILELDKAPNDFHARYSATGKIYHYYLHLDPVINPFNRLYTTYHPYPLDLSLIQKALPHFEGTHNFTSFANEPTKGCVTKKPVRTLHHIKILQEQRGICLEFKGNGFLYKMVRNITGTLLEVGKKKLDPQEIPTIIKAKDRRKAGQTAPPQGLFLMQVLYDQQLIC